MKVRRASSKAAALLALFLGLLFLAFQRTARAEDIFGRSGIYDATRSPVLQGLSLDYATIAKDHPTFAERRGLAGAPTVQVRRNFVYVQDADGTLTIPYQSGADLFASFNFTLRELYEAVPDEFEFVYMFTAFRTGVGAFFYQPEENTIRGIGEPLFDMNGSSPRQGFVFMNYWLSFEELFGAGGAGFVRAQSLSVFNQEAGHRWISFVQAGVDGNGSGQDVLRGRDDSHWSYFLHTGGSPLEGNAWRDNGNGSFTTVTSFQNWRYSELDQYLMGLRPESEVAPWFVITNPVAGNARDMFGQPVTPSSPPQIFQPITIQGQRVDLTVRDIITRNGARVPDVNTSPKRWRAVFVILAGRDGGLSEAQRLRFEGMVDDYALGFKEGTLSRGELDYALQATPRAPIGGICAVPEDCDALESNVCLVVPPVPAGSGMCTRPCATGASCPAGWCCEPSAANVRVCLPESICAPPPSEEATPDGGTPPQAECLCDRAGGCDEGCSCDPACAAISVPCACDVTYGCDRTSDGDAACACDPECAGRLLEADPEGGCSCRDTSHHPLPRPFFGRGLVLGALSLATVLLMAWKKRSRAKARVGS